MNSCVAETDTLYFLGDFCRGNGKDALAYRQRIRCKNIFFIEGNHDASTKKISAQFGWWKLPNQGRACRNQGPGSTYRAMPLRDARLASFVPRSVAPLWPLHTGIWQMIRSRFRWRGRRRSRFSTMEGDSRDRGTNGLEDCASIGCRRFEEIEERMAGKIACRSVVKCCRLPSVGSNRSRLPSTPLQ